MSHSWRVLSAFLVIFVLTGVAFADDTTRVSVKGKTEGEALTLSLKVEEGVEAPQMVGALVRSVPSQRLILVQWDAASVGEALRDEIEAEGALAMVESRPGDSFPRVTVRWEPLGDQGFLVEAIYAGGAREVLSAAKVTSMDRFEWSSTITGLKTKAK